MVFDWNPADSGALKRAGILVQASGEVKSLVTH